MDSEPGSVRESGLWADVPRHQLVLEENQLGARELDAHGGSFPECGLGTFFRWSSKDRICGYVTIRCKDYLQQYGKHAHSTLLPPKSSLCFGNSRQLGPAVVSSSRQFR